MTKKEAYAAAVSVVMVWGSVLSANSVAAQQQSLAEPTRSVVSGAIELSAVPPSRQDGVIEGRIVQYDSRSGAELDMQPEDMTIYIYQVVVNVSNLAGLEGGEKVTLRSKLAPPKDWEGREITMQATEFAGGSSYWLTAFD